jgi:predicted negative regulator of RcsB-dependent stress response
MISPIIWAIFFFLWKTTMAVYDLEEQEQLDELKTWWKQYGNWVTHILLAAALVAVSWQGWNWWQRSQAVAASALYSSLQQAQRDAKRSRELAGELITQYSATAYAGMGALLAARVQVDAGELKNARAQLTWVADNAKDRGMRDLGRLRLVAVLLDEKSFDEAARYLALEPAPSFAPRFAEMKGDLFAAQGKIAEARGAYDAALQALAAKTSDTESKPPTGYVAVVQAKRDSLGDVSK